jgi:DNA-binding beta-propeller fold protein YncE
MRNCLFALALLVGGCHWALNDKGTDPQAAQLYFPSGIAMDPLGQYVYVANGNADLRYGGGTVVMIDMLSFECTIAEFRRYSPVDPKNDPKTVLPAACLRYDHQPEYWDDLAVRAKCVHDAADRSIIDCDESAFILQNSTVRIGNFAGAIQLQSDAPDPKTGDSGHRTLFVAVRGDPSITTIQVNLPADPKNIDLPGVLQCVAHPDQLAQRAQYHEDPFNPGHFITTAPAPCEADYLIQDYTCQNQPSCIPGTDSNSRNQLPTEPFGMQIDETRQLLLVSHLQSGQVSVINAQPGVETKNALISESAAFFPPDTTGRHGAFAMAQQHPTDPHSLWYMTSNVNPIIATFRIGDSNAIIPTATTLAVPESTFGINASFAQGADVRDIVFDSDGNRAFATDANPPSVVVIDTRTDTTNGNIPHNVVTDIVDVCQTPSHTGVRRFTVAGAPGTPARTKTKIVVVCFLSSQLMIVDPDRPGVDETIFSGLSGPDHIAFNFTDDGVSHPVAQLGVGRHGYVTNYSESTVAVVDLEPGSATENRVLARLGLTPDGLNP